MVISDAWAECDSTTPHLYVIATSGDGYLPSQWRHLDYLPYPLLREKSGNGICRPFFCARR